MLYTREIINKNIRFHDCVLSVDGSVDIKHYDYQHLSSLVDAYKNLFLKKGATRGRSVVIGTQARVEQIALVLACSELGMNIVIVGNPFPIVGHDNQVVKSVYTPGVISEQYRSLLPVDFFVVKSEDCTDKFQAFKDTCRLTIVLDRETLDYTANDKILATDETSLLKCSGQGIAGTTKVIQHTQGFITALSQRNAKHFYGSMGMLTNLAHGSSAATFFLPGLIAENVTDFYNIYALNVKLLGLLKDNNVILNHLMFPYTHLVDEFFNLDTGLPECTIYSLGLIRTEWLSKLNHTVKDIISIFGSTETSGPTMINQASDSDFAENTYKAIDDFYQLTITENNELEVLMPVYGTVINTRDSFAIQGRKYAHQGRSNICRINDLAINGNKYQEFINGLVQAELIIDTLKDRIYLAVWDADAPESSVKEIDELLKKNSQGRHYISKYNKLNHSDYFKNNKLDKESLKEYFRKK